MFDIKIHMQVTCDKAMIQADVYKYSAFFCKAKFGQNKNY